MARKPPKFKRPGGFIQLPASMVKSEQFRALSPNARWLAMELKLRWFEKKGVVHMSVRDASDALGFSSTTPGERALAELESAGFIRLIAESTFLGRKSREWALTWESLNGHEPSDEWLSVPAEKNPPSATAYTKGALRTPQRTQRKSKNRESMT